MNSTDFTVENHGSIFIFRANTDAAREFADLCDGYQPYAPNAIVVEHSYVLSLIDTIRDRNGEVS
jgi:hypothetical protein